MLVGRHWTGYGIDSTPCVRGFVGTLPMISSSDSDLSLSRLGNEVERSPSSLS